MKEGRRGCSWTLGFLPRKRSIDTTPLTYRTGRGVQCVCQDWHATDLTGEGKVKGRSAFREWGA